VLISRHTVHWVVVCEYGGGEYMTTTKVIELTLSY
jgi:hypothetical protein